MKNFTPKDPITNELEQKENEEKLLRYQTQLRKFQLIDEIKNGLGNEIKERRGTVKIIKKPWYKKLGIFMKKIFTKF